VTAPLKVNGLAQRLAHVAADVMDPTLRDEVLRGLRATPKTLPPKLFYDAAGAELFERITTLPEYYLTRAELEILRNRAGEIAALTGPGAVLVEYGSGAGVKVRLLLDAMVEPAAYIPVDISAAQLARVAEEIRDEYPHIPVHPVCADYTRPLDIPALHPRRRRLAFFPGSTIGNFHPTEAAAFLRRIRNTLGHDGALVLGVDRIKETATLNAAYNDAQGVTEAFNLNMLRRLNRELGADFNLASFAHRAFVNECAARVEMHLESLACQTVHVAGERFAFEQGETIWTESSYKYSEAAFETLVSSAAFATTRLWTDSADRFWVAYLTAATQPSARSDSALR
jgi:L-histidine Nalpha-methyltransferase